MYNESEYVVRSGRDNPRSLGGSVSGSFIIFTRLSRCSDGSLASEYQVSDIFLPSSATRSCFVANCNLSPTRFPTAPNIWEVERHQ